MILNESEVHKMLKHKINKEFSDGFIKDLADIIDSCIENQTDSATIKFEFGGRILNVEMKFSVEEDD